MKTDEFMETFAELLSQALERRVTMRLMAEAERFKSCKNEQEAVRIIESHTEDVLDSIWQQIMPILAGSPLPAGTSPIIAANIRNFTHQILHGSPEHRAWLIAACEAYLRNQSIPEPVG